MKLSQPVSYYTVRQPIADVLSALSLQSGTPVLYSPGTDAIVSDVRLQGSMQAAIDMLCTEHGLYAAFDGTRWLISGPEATRTQTFSLPRSRAMRTVRLLDTLYPYRSKGSLEIHEDIGLVVARGSQSFVDGLRRALDLDMVATEPDDVTVIRYGQKSSDDAT